MNCRASIKYLGQICEPRTFCSKTVAPKENERTGNILNIDVKHGYFCPNEINF